MNIRKGLSLPKHFCARFVCLPNEQLLLATRTHWFDILSPIGGVGIVAVVCSAVILFLLINGALSFLHFLSLLLIVWAIAAGVISFTFFSWYFHFYIVTTRKILEVRSLPFIYYNVNDVLLDQVRCTELDIQRNGLIASLVNMGSIIITFDRPTHQEEFTLVNIHDPESVGIFLGDMLETIRGNPRENDQAFWYKEPTKNRYRFTEEIYPRLTPS
ncbi:MAG: hypothetical protein Q8Q49_03505 [bacterium]|nr:hypothetical protein [bacterium]